MTTPATVLPPEAGQDIPLRLVEPELARQMKGLQGSLEHPIQIARMSNLVIFCDRRETAEAMAAQVPQVVAAHPARVLLLVGEAESALAPITATALVRPLPSRIQSHSCSELVTLHAGGAAVAGLPFAVRALLVGDLPYNLWWAGSQPPPLAGAFLFDLADNAQQIIYDSRGWLEPARAVAATASWLQGVNQGLRGGRWRVASDLNWRRLKFWRRLLVQALEPAAAPGAADTATELLLEHGPHSVIQAWQLASWLTRRLDWQVQAGKIEPGVEIQWQFRAAHGRVNVVIRRLADVPSEMRQVRLRCLIGGQPGALVLRHLDSGHLEVVTEGVASAPRTVTVQSQTLAELVGRQLSDRERDPIFIESMTVAQSLAQSLLR